MRHTHGFDEFDTGNGCRTCAVRNNFHILEVPASELQSIDQAGGGNDGRAVLVIMEYWDVQPFAKLLLDDETFRRLDVFKIDATKGGCQCRHCVDETISIGRVHLEIQPVDISKFLEQDGFAFHDRLGGGSADIPKAQNSCAIRYNGDEVSLGCVVIGGIGVFCDFKARCRNAG